MRALPLGLTIGLLCLAGLSTALGPHNGLKDPRHLASQLAPASTVSSTASGRRFTPNNEVYVESYRKSGSRHFETRAEAHSGSGDSKSLQADALHANDKHSESGLPLNTAFAPPTSSPLETSFVYLSLTTTMGYAELAATICPQIGAITTTLQIINSYGYSDLGWIDLPECVFDNGINIESFTLQNVAIYGGTGTNDPLLRFPTSTQSLTLTSVWLVNGTTSLDPPVSGQHLAAPDWTTFSTRMVSLTSFHCNLCGLYTVPTKLPPNVINLDLSDNLLNGTIPGTLLSNFNTSYPAATLDLRLIFDDNQLTGMIPSNLFSAIGAGTHQIRSLDLSIDRNNLTGPLPGSVFTVLKISGSFTVSMTNNLITGALPADFLYGLFDSSMTAFLLDLSNNRINGAIPSSFLTATVITSINFFQVDLGNNQLSGQLPDALLNFASCGIAQMLLRFPNNALSGTVPALFETAKCPSLTKFSLYAPNNRITGAVNPYILRSGSTVGITTDLDFSYNNLTDTFNFAFFTGQLSPNRLSMVLDHNQMSGSPFDAFATMENITSFPTLSITASHNNFNGDIPFLLFQSWSANGQIPSSGLATFSLDVSYNNLQGSVPPLFDSFKYAYEARIILNFANNSLSSQFPSNLFSPAVTQGLTEVALNLTGNAINSLPASLFSGELPGLTSVWIYLDSNAIMGLPTGFLSTVPSSLTQLNLNFDHNNLGTLPTSFLLSNSTRSFFLTASFVGCELTGRLLTPLVNLSRLYAANIILNDNHFYGNFNLSNVITPTYGTIGTEITISATNNNFNGTLAVENMRTSDETIMLLVFANNPFTALSIDPSSIPCLSLLDVTNNTKLTGTLPTDIFGYGLTKLLAANTALTGPMPNFEDFNGYNSLQELDLSGTSIDFCTPANRPYFDSSMEICSLAHTNAESKCQSKYPEQCFGGMRAPVACDLKTRPSPDFNCTGGVWVATSSIATPTLVIPSGATQTVVQGNVGSSTIVFGSVGSTLVVSGCLNNLTAITIELTKTEIEKLTSKTSQLLIAFNGSDPSCSDLSAVQVNLKRRDSSCRRVSAQNSVSSGQLSALFTVDASRCKTWWIILVSVLCGAALVFVIVFVLLVLFVPAVRECVRPYSKRRHASSMS